MTQTAQAKAKSGLAIVLGLGAIIWMIEGVSITLVWMPLLMIGGAALLVKSVQKDADEVIDARGDQFLADLKKREEEQD